MRRRLVWVCAAALLATGCRNMPGPFAPPVQRQPLEDFGWATAGQDVTVGVHIDKPWIPPEGGPKRGLTLMRIGLTQ